MNPIKHLPLVHYIVGKKFPAYKYDDDVLQEGRLGLIVAAKNYDKSKGTFATFAYKYISGYISNYLFPNERKYSREETTRTIGNEIIGIPYSDMTISYDQIEELENKIDVEQLLNRALMKKRISEKDIDLLENRFYNDKTFQSIAAENGISRQGNNWKINSIIKKIRKEI